MTFKQFMKAVFFAPADLLNRLFFGYDYRDENTRKKEHVTGLMELALAAVYIVGSAISQLVANNRKTISLALWLSAAAVTAAVLTVAFWPAALAAVTGFSIYGLSIASVFGTSFTASLVGTGVVAAALTSAAVIASSAVVNTISAIVGCFCKPKKTEESQGNPDDFLPTKSQMRALATEASVRRQQQVDARADVEPMHTGGLYKAVPVYEDTAQEPVLTGSPTAK